MSRVCPLPPRSSAYKTALLKDLEVASQRLASAKDAAVKRLAGNYELAAGCKVSWQNLCVYVGVTTSLYCIPHKYTIHYIVIRDGDNFELSHGWGHPFNAKELGSALEMFKKNAIAVRSHIKPKAKAKAKAKANASPVASVWDFPIFWQVLWQQTDLIEIIQKLVFDAAGWKLPCPFAPGDSGWAFILLNYLSNEAICSVLWLSGGAASSQHKFQWFPNMDDDSCSYRSTSWLGIQRAWKFWTAVMKFQY